MNPLDKNANVRLSVFSGGNLIKSLPGLISVCVYKDVNHNSRATLVFSADDRTEDENSGSKHEIFAPGKVIRIEAGYGDDESPIFEGTVVNHGFSISEGNAAELRIECRDYTSPTTREDANDSFKLKVTNGVNLIEFRGEWPAPGQQGDIPAIRTDVQCLNTATSQLQGYCKFQGSAKAVQGGTLELDGLSKPFNGIVHIDSVKHEISGGRWTTTVDFGASLKNIAENSDKAGIIQTLGNNLIQINDKDKSIQLTDQHNNKITMDSQGICIESAKELIFKAKTNVIIDANANIELNAKSNIGLTGVDISASANAHLTVKGNAKAEISAVGQTIVKGGMVMIN